MGFSDDGTFELKGSNLLNNGNIGGFKTADTNMEFEIASMTRPGTFTDISDSPSKIFILYGNNRAIEVPMGCQ